MRQTPRGGDLPWGHEVDAPELPGGWPGRHVPWLTPSSLLSTHQLQPGTPCPGRQWGMLWDLQLKLFHRDFIAIITLVHLQLSCARAQGVDYTSEDKPSSCALVHKRGRPYSECMSCNDPSVKRLYYSTVVSLPLYMSIQQVWDVVVVVSFPRPCDVLAGARL